MNGEGFPLMGTLIFIGIMFISVVPMLLIMKQADNIFEQEKLDSTTR